MSIEMIDDISICNGALILLGAQSIQSLDENTQEAIMCKNRFYTARDTVIQSFPWNSCTFRQTLTQLTTKPVFDYQVMYSLPTDPYCLMIMQLYETDDWRIEHITGGDGGQTPVLVTNTTVANAIFIGRITSNYPVNLAELMSTYMAAQMAYKLTGSLEIQKQMFGIYQQKRLDACEIEGRHGNMPNNTHDIYIDTWVHDRR
jgi:hypothetical protein